MKTSPYLLLLLLSLVFVACGPERNPNVVVVHFLNEPPNLHPTNSNNGYTNQINALCYQQLMLTGRENGKLVAELAEEPIEFTEDRLSFSFTVREDAKWPSGKPITAEDVVFSYKILACPLVETGQRGAGIARVESFTVDPNNNRRCTVVFNEYSINNALFGATTQIMDRSFFDPDNVLGGFSFAELLSEDSVLLSDPKLVEWAGTYNDPQMGLEISRMQSGSGPYRVESWLPQQQITLVRNPDFWAKGIEHKEGLFEQGPDKIIYKFVKDDKAAELQIKQQEIDASYMMSSVTYEQLEESEAVQESYHLSVVPRNNYAFVALNNDADGINHPRIFQDKAVRRALALAQPIDDIIEEVLPGVATRTASPIPPYHPDYNPNIEYLPYDRAQAASMLEAAGWKDTDGDRIRDKVVDGSRIPLKFTLTYPPNGNTLIRLAEAIAKAWKEVGVEVELDPQDFAKINELVGTGDFDALMIALRTPNVPYDFSQIFHSESGGNFMGYSNAAVDDLIDQANTERDPAKRKTLIDQIQVDIYNDQPCIFFYNATRKLALHKRFGEADFSPNDPHISITNLSVAGNWSWDGSKWVEQ
ncbi:MAG: ABC transporter substrate-binding protein [Bacteroidota bacterium]